MIWYTWFWLLLIVCYMVWVLVLAYRPNELYLCIGSFVNQLTIQFLVEPQYVWAAMTRDYTLNHFWTVDP